MEQQTGSRTKTWFHLTVGVLYLSSPDAGIFVGVYKLVEVRIAVVPGGPMYGRRDSRNNRTVDELIVAMAKIGLSVATDYSSQEGKTNKRSEPS